MARSRTAAASLFGQPWNQPGKTPLVRYSAMLSEELAEGAVAVQVRDGLQGVDQGLDRSLAAGLDLADRGPGQVD